jgi:hypothetical protein
MPPPAVGAVERLDRILKDLDGVCTDLNGEEEETISKADNAKSAVTTLRNSLKRSQVEQVAELVRTKKWLQTAELLKKNFPGSGIGLVEEVLALVYVGDDLDNLSSAIEWVDKLDARLLSGAYRTLYEQIQFKKHIDQPQVLLLSRKVGKLPDGVLADVRTQLDSDCGRIIERIVEGIKQKDYSFSALKVGRGVFGSIVEEIVAKFNTANLEDVLLLLQYSLQLPKVTHSTVSKWLHTHSLLGSEQALHLWAHAKFVVQQDARWVVHMACNGLNFIPKKHHLNYINQRLNQKQLRVKISDQISPCIF